MTKRGNNEGSIYKRDDGRWAAALSLSGGKRHTLYGKTFQEVRGKLTAATRDRDTGVPVTRQRQTVGPFLQQWLEDSVRPTVRPRTFERYEGIVINHLIPSIGRRTLHDLTPQDVQALYTEKLKSGLSARSVEHIHAVLRRALGQALKWSLVARNVSTLVDVPRPHRTEVHPYSSEEARRLLEAIRGHRMEALYVLCLTVGLRQGEALGLRWEDVDLDEGTLHVRRALQRIEGTYRLVEPKTSRSRRTIALPETAAVALWARYTREQDAKAQAGPS